MFFVTSVVIAVFSDVFCHHFLSNNIFCDHIFCDHFFVITFLSNNIFCEHIFCDHFFVITFLSIFCILGRGRGRKGGSSPLQPPSPASSPPGFKTLGLPLVKYHERRCETADTKTLGFNTLGV